jgi:hypothetical protein
LLQRFEQEADSLKGVGIQASHVLLEVVYVAKIKESKHKRIEHSERMRSGPFTNLTSILAEGDVTAIMEAIFDGPVLTVQLEQQMRISFAGSREVLPLAQERD